MNKEIKEKLDAYIMKHMEERKTMTIEDFEANYLGEKIESESISNKIRSILEEGNKAIKRFRKTDEKEMKTFNHILNMEENEHYKQFKLEVIRSLNSYIEDCVKNRKTISIKHFQQEIIKREINNQGLFKEIINLIDSNNEKIKLFKFIDKRKEETWNEKLGEIEAKNVDEKFHSTEEWQAIFDNESEFELDRRKHEAYQDEIVANEELLNQYESYLVNRFKNLVKNNKHNLVFEYNSMKDTYSIKLAFMKSRIDSAVYVSNIATISEIIKNQDDWDRLNIQCNIDPSTLLEYR